MLGGVQAEAVDSDRLHEPLGIAHEVAQSVLLDGVSRQRIGVVEGIDGDVGLARGRVIDHDRLEASVGVEPPVVLVGHVRQPSVSRNGAGTNVVGESGNRTANHPIIGGVVDIHQACEPPVEIAGGEFGMVVSVDGVGERDVEPGVAAGIIEPGRAQVREAAVVPDQIHVVVQSGAMSRLHRSAQAGLRAVEGAIAGTGLAQVKPVILVIANGEVALVGPAGRRRIDGAVAGLEQVRHAFLDRCVGTLKPLEKHGRRDILGQSRAPQRACQNHGRRTRPESPSFCRHFMHRDHSLPSVPPAYYGA